ncbi:DUF1475 family protein [Petrocella sp. FN5]|nr:DUF1475 family protein [Petrocella sp. FN5]MDF1618442.1 DUF1475 family protein [Petrocella sp. FN5]
MHLTRKERLMKIAKLIVLLGVMAMTGALFFGFTQGDFFVDGSAVLANPWGIVSMVDLYVGFILFSMWIAFREKHVLQAALWIVLMMVFGFLTGALYVLIHLIVSKGDWTKFFMGARQ